MTTSIKRPWVLIILDGWGQRQESVANAVALAHTPCLDELSARYPQTRLQCFGEAVGLPPGVMGNSEVGHMNIGAGRVVYQDLVRINRAIADGSFFTNESLVTAMADVARNERNLHLMGLLSDGGVHSEFGHLLALLEMAARQGLKPERVFIHAILDGRDTPPNSGISYLGQLQDYLENHPQGRVASICGRYYAMDRDTRWERTARAYDLYTQGKGTAAQEPLAAVKQAYGREEWDEFLQPIVISNPQDEPLTRVASGDGIIFFNFRADRARQITRAFTEPGFDAFDSGPRPQLGAFVCMTLYDEHFDLPMAFAPIHLDQVLGEVLSRNHRRQLRIAETEKYAHVTYFFNGGEETPFPGEERCLIPSPREVATYDLKPEMSAAEVAEELLKRLKTGQYDLMVVNFANMDMVGHTGVLEAAIKACETVDRCLKLIVDEIQRQGGAALITADHGNAEIMAQADGSPHTAHSLNPVKLLLMDDRDPGLVLKKGKLADIAPTILELMGLAQPREMTGKSLIKKN
ncbi:MAG: 2,3-bisphosphoglycerate-independent phosphoglycerate mutase [Desulfobacterales bacterium]